MSVADGGNSEQAKMWNGTSGQAWVDAQSSLDLMFKPIENLLVEAAAALAPRRLLDVGCGTGATTLAIARRLGPATLCTGIDISSPMIGAARDRADRERLPVTFVCADAQTYDFEPSGLDAIVSRFGVMFFEDPVAAFANLRRAARAGGELRLVAWRGMEENPFMTTAERAAAPILPNLPARSPDRPGQFAFADDGRVGAVLGEAGWDRIEIVPLDVPCSLPEKELVPYLSRLGPVGRALDEADEGTRARVLETVRAAFDRYVQGRDVHFVAACWMIRARSRD